MVWGRNMFILSCGLPYTRASRYILMDSNSVVCVTLAHSLVWCGGMPLVCVKCAVVCSA